MQRSVVNQQERSLLGSQNLRHQLMCWSLPEEEKPEVIGLSKPSAEAFCSKAESICKWAESQSHWSWI